MMEQESIEKVLLGVGIHRGFPVKRAQLAGKIAGHAKLGGTPFSEEVAQVLYAEAAQGRASSNPPATMREWLSDGSWVTLYKEIRNEYRWVKPKAERRAPGDEPSAVERNAAIDLEQWHGYLLDKIDRLGEHRALSDVQRTYNLDPEVVRRHFEHASLSVHQCSFDELVRKRDDERRKLRRSLRQSTDRGPDPVEVFK